MGAIDIATEIDRNTRDYVVRGTLLVHYDLPADAVLLDQDILEIEFECGMRIDVGWFPEHDPNGEFVVRIIDKRHRLVETSRSKTVCEVVAAIQRFTRKIRRMA